VPIRIAIFKFALRRNVRNPAFLAIYRRIFGEISSMTT